MKTDYEGQAPLIYDGHSVVISLETQLQSLSPVVHHVLCERRDDGDDDEEETDLANDGADDI